METPKILVIGAGGIGCELLKTLILSGFSNITILDLDTIDKSNLNRQFLFQKKDIGQSKALTAASVLTSLRPSLSIQGLHTNICTQPASFFAGFDLIFNALDNLAARRFVNRICVSINKAFIDAGTKGKTGQVSVHIPKQNLCYDCEDKQIPKQYAVCTIRSTPSILEHCIAWGKYLYQVLYGPEDPSNILSDLAPNTDLTEKALFDSLFVNDLPINATPLTYPDSVTPCLYNENDPGLTLQELVNTFVFTVSSLKTRTRKDFDKNDKPCVHFVAAVSNLRGLNFAIQSKTTSEVQQVAGNIIPAIGSTNAIVAGLQVIEGLKVLSQNPNFGTIWVNQHVSNNKFIIPTLSQPPNPQVSFTQCFICSTGKIVEEMDLDKQTLSGLLSEVLINKLNFSEPCLYKDGNALYESGEGIEEENVQAFEINKKRTLRELGVEHEEEIYCMVRGR